MPALSVVDRSGAAHSLNGEVGHSVMEIIRDNGLDELLALCGGALSCATCHVYIDDAHISDFPPMSGDEDDLLDSSPHRTGQSRLSCQIRLTDQIEGLIVTIACDD